MNTTTPDFALENQEPTASVTSVGVGSSALLGPFGLEALCDELLKRYGPRVTIRTEWEVYGTAEQTVSVDGQKVATITARPINPVQMPRDIGRPQGPREYVLVPNDQFGEPMTRPTKSPDQGENRDS